MWLWHEARRDAAGVAPERFWERSISLIAAVCRCASLLVMFCWGDSSRGQLGLPGTEQSIIIPKPLNTFGEKIFQVSCGEQHTLFLMETGRVMSCGGNSKGQLGRAKSKDAKSLVIESLGGVAAVACGQEHSLALCESGQVFSWGGGGEGQLGLNSPVSKCPKPVLVQIPLQLPIPVVQVACGNVHSLALTKGGEVFSWGQNNFGQLGLGKDVSLQAIPAQIRALVGVPVIQISAGGAHTLALTLSAQVFCCGANSAGQLGLKRIDEKGRFSLCAIPALRGLAITSISCGEAHTAILTKSGEVYTFGEGMYGQLGHCSTNNELLPRKVKGIDGEARQVSCGSHHTVVLMSSGILYAFGRGVKGQLGHGRTEDSMNPVKVNGPWSIAAGEKDKAMRISSGWNSNFMFFSHPKTSVLGEPVGKLEASQVLKWVSVTERDRYMEEAKREIFLTCSTSSNLVASFLKDSGAASRSSAGTVKVDLTAASQTFDKLLQIPWIKKTMNLTPVVHTLLFAAPVMKCPEIFLLLPTCSILHEEHNVINLLLPLAVAITDLSESTLKILREQWSSMEACMLTKHIAMWKNALAFLLKSNIWLNFNPGVKAVLEVLKYIFKANKRAEKKRRVPFSEFYIEEIGTAPLLLQNDVTLYRNIQWGLVQDVDTTPAVYCNYPFLLDLQSKISVFNYVAAITKMTHQFMYNNAGPGGMFPELATREPPAPIIQLKLRRTALLEDTFRQLANADHDNFKKELLVQFVDNSILTDVNKRDFFLHAFNELLDSESKMFMYNDSKTMVWFPAKPKLETNRYFLFGILCGLALYNKNIVHMPFPLAMFKKLLNVKLTLEDVIEFSPVLGESLRYLLHDYTDDDVENMDITFCVNWDGECVELDPQEKGKLVTSSNKKQFVDAYVDHILNKSVNQLFEEFRRGFYKVCDRDIVEFFQPEELRGVMVGTEEYDWVIFRQNTVYDGQYHEQHPTIITFWEVFEELTEEQKKAFLLFLTGCDRVPIVGMQEIRMVISVLPNSTQAHLPESLTCHSILMLPQYHSQQLLQEKLVEALNHNRGFWRE